jgi:hypothetical protein
MSSKTFSHPSLENASQENGATPKEVAKLGNMTKSAAMTEPNNMANWPSWPEGAAHSAADSPHAVE